MLSHIKERGIEGNGPSRSRDWITIRISRFPVKFPGLYLTFSLKEIKSRHTPSSLLNFDPSDFCFVLFLVLLTF